jgi:3-methyladenine DNA glycosylase AlkD
VNYGEIFGQLKSLANPEAVAGMARYGINPFRAYGVSIPDLRKIAATAGRNHAWAEKLWSSGVHEARILATMIDEPSSLTEEQMDRWVKDFRSWDLCDQCCNNLFRTWPRAHDKAVSWSAREEEFVKRAGFVLMAVLAVHDRQALDEQFLRFIPEIIRGSVDRRNFVKKAVNWALRQIGKRNGRLNATAIEAAKEIRERDSRSARWIAADAIRELTGDAVQKRLRSQRQDD